MQESRKQNDAAEELTSSMFSYIKKKYEEPRNSFEQEDPIQSNQREYVGKNTRSQTMIPESSPDANQEIHSKQLSTSIC